MLIGKSERSAVNCAVLRAGSGCECKAVVRREHGEFKLDSVGWFNLKWDIVVVGVFGQLNAESLVATVLVPGRLDSKDSKICGLNIPRRS